MSSSLIDGSNKAVRDIFSNKMIALQKKYEKSNFAKNIAFGKVTLLHPLDLVGVLDNLVDLALELALLLQLLVLLDPFYNFLEYKYLGTLF